nr:MAG TPA: hypothetical protein [Caudoviricetes sp.]
MNLFHRHKKINDVLEVNYTCYCKDKPSGIDSSETFFFVKVGNLWIHSAKFEGKYLHDSIWDSSDERQLNPKAGQCYYVKTSKELTFAQRFDDFSKAVLAADYCGGKVISMEPREIEVSKELTKAVTKLAEMRIKN